MLNTHQLQAASSEVHSPRAGPPALPAAPQTCRFAKANTAICTHPQTMPSSSGIHASVEKQVHSSACRVLVRACNAQAHAVSAALCSADRNTSCSRISIVRHNRVPQHHEHFAVCFTHSTHLRPASSPQNASSGLRERAWFLRSSSPT